MAPNPDNRLAVDYILKELGAMHRDRLTQEVVAMTGNDPRSVGQTLRYMLSQGAIFDAGTGQIQLCPQGVNQPASAPLRRENDTPVNGVRVVARGDKVRLPAFMEGRQGNRVTVEHVTAHDGVVRFQLKVDGVWVNMPLFGSLRICIDGDFSGLAEPEDVNIAEGYRLIYHDGTVFEAPLAAGTPVALARGRDE